MRENKGTEGRYGFYALLAVNAAVLVVAWHRRLWCVVLCKVISRAMMKKLYKEIHLKTLHWVNMVF